MSRETKAHVVLVVWLLLVPPALRDDEAHGTWTVVVDARLERWSSQWPGGAGFPSLEVCERRKADRIVEELDLAQSAEGVDARGDKVDIIEKSYEALRNPKRLSRPLAWLVRMRLSRCVPAEHMYPPESKK